MLSSHIARKATSVQEEEEAVGLLPQQLAAYEGAGPTLSLEPLLAALHACDWDSITRKTGGKVSQLTGELPV